MNVLVVGGGGREHAIAWKLAQSHSIVKVFVAPGNPGMSVDAKIFRENIPSSDFPALERLCREKEISFVVVGPDQALADGLVDFLEAKGIPAFGPTQAASRIESSKAFAKQLMKEKGIPTARFRLFGSAEEAEAFLEKDPWHGDGWVLKADGLALGKGVVVCSKKKEAKAALETLKHLGNAAATLVVEEKLTGPEVSAFYICDGEDAVCLGYACDYKQIFDGGKGPNTGGMGSYSPADWMDESIPPKVEAEIVKPLLAAMREKKTPFKGILFIGLMITAGGPKVLEFNARFGDPETQSLLPLITQDLLPWFMAARDGRLKELSKSGPRRAEGCAVHVVLAAKGYPGGEGVTVEKGQPVAVEPWILANKQFEQNVKVFFAGVGGELGALKTSGGRVLGVTALGKDRVSARSLAYQAIEAVSFSGMQKRSDIGT